MMMAISLGQRMSTHNPTPLCSYTRISPRVPSIRPHPGKHSTFRNPPLERILFQLASGERQSWEPMNLAEAATC